MTNRSGTRIETPITDVRLLITEISSTSYRFPLTERTDAESLARMQSGAQKAKAVLDQLQDCGWFSGEPDVSILAIVGGGPGRNVLARPGTEHLHVLPVDEDQVIEWIDDGSVEQRRALLIDTKGPPHVYGRARCWSWRVCFCKLPRSVPSTCRPPNRESIQGPLWLTVISCSFDAVTSV